MKNLTAFFLILFPFVCHSQWANTGSNIYNTNTGNVGIGTSSPSTNLHIASVNEGGIRIGAVGNAGNIAVALSAQTLQYNLDFTGYRDVEADQIGARISALRFNNYGNNTAYVQTTGLAFYTNSSGWTSGTTDLQERIRVAPDGNVGIGTTSPDQKLTVNGKIKAEEIQVVVDVPADYVFEKDYRLLPLKDVANYVKANKHLPDMPDAQSIIDNGWQVGEMNNKLLQKVEELTLYLINQENEITKLREISQAQAKEIIDLKSNELTREK